MPQGKVKWFDVKKGFGFILREDAPDLFVHFSGIKADGFKSLHEGDTVSYEISKCDKGEQASDVVVLEKCKKPKGRGKGRESDEE